MGSSLTAADGPPAAAASTAAPGWAAAAQHQLSAALDHTKEQLGAASSSGLGVAVLGAAVGGLVAGPLGAAAGAKSGAAMMAAGALGGAVAHYARGGSQPSGAEEEESRGQEMQPTKARPPSPPGTAQ